MLQQNYPTWLKSKRSEYTQQQNQSYLKDNNIPVTLERLDAVLKDDLRRCVEQLIEKPIQHVLTIYDLFKHQNQIYLVSECQDGVKLLSSLSTDDQKLEALTQIATGLLELHKMSYIHRNVCPENIKYINGFWKLTTLNNVLDKVCVQFPPPVGSFSYHAPELQAPNLNYSETIDIFALACVAYELFSNEKMFQDQNEPRSKIPQRCYVKIQKMPQEVQDFIKTNIEAKERSLTIKIDVFKTQKNGHPTFISPHNPFLPQPNQLPNQNVTTQIAPNMDKRFSAPNFIGQTSNPTQQIFPKPIQQAQPVQFPKSNQNPHDQGKNDFPKPSQPSGIPPVLQKQNNQFVQNYPNQQFQPKLAQEKFNDQNQFGGYRQFTPTPNIMPTGNFGGNPQATRQQFPTLQSASLSSEKQQQQFMMNSEQYPNNQPSQQQPQMNQEQLEREQKFQEEQKKKEERARKIEVQIKIKTLFLFSDEQDAIPQISKKIVDNVRDKCHPLTQNQK